MSKLKFEEADIGYRLKNGHIKLLQNINISGKQNELIALIGVNGSGKSTLLRTVTGLQKLLSGKIKIDEKELPKYRKIELAKKIAFVSSEIIRTKYLKVIDTVSLGRFPHQKFSNQNSAKDKEIIERALSIVGMSDFKERSINEISDGERQKVMTARALAQDTDIILLDEPAAFLDMENKFSLYKILYDTVHNFNKTIIFSTHDLNIALKYCDKVWLIKDKKIVEGSPEDLILNNEFQNIFSDKHVFFNSETFEFTVQPDQKYPINVIDHSNSEMLRNTVINALKRKAFFESEKPADIKIEIFSPERFLIRNKEKTYELTDVYQLTRILTKLNF